VSALTTYCLASRLMLFGYNPGTAFWSSSTVFFLITFFKGFVRCIFRQSFFLRTHKALENFASGYIRSFRLQEYVKIRYAAVYQTLPLSFSFENQKNSLHLALSKSQNLVHTV
jgi:hypothetical protein